MEQTETQQGITEEATLPDIPTGETKVSETKEQDDINRRIQSEIDRRLAPIYQERDSHKQRAEVLERDYQDLQKQQEELDAEISRMQDEAYKDDPELLKSAKSKRQLVKDKRDLETREKKLKDVENALGMQMKALDVAEISAMYGVNPKVLERADVQNRQELEDFAREIAGERKPVQGKPEQKKDTQIYDRGISDVGGTTDTEFLKLYSEGKSDDHARAKKLMNM